MARPQKEGLDYFSHDTYSESDEKIQAMIYLYGNEGYAFYYRLLEHIYRTADGELDISDAETRKILARNLNTSLAKFNKMLGTALKKGLLDAELFQKTSKLSSSGVKRRVRAVLDKREEMKARYEQKHGVSDAVIPVSDAETQQKPYKEKESKVNINKDKENITTVTTDRAEIFKLFENEIGTLTPVTSEGIKDWIEEHPPDEVIFAIKEAVKAGVRKPSYINAILESRKAEGYPPERRRKQNVGPQANRGNNQGGYQGGKTRILSDKERAIADAQYDREHGFV